MAHRIARAAGSLTIALTFVAATAPATASVHHRPTHRTAHAAHRPVKPKHHATKPAAHRDAAPPGATHVPGSGIKLYCAGRSNPLLIRKSTQGSGTTVTVVCR
jgi:hypothetical protein